MRKLEVLCGAGGAETNGEREGEEARSHSGIATGLSHPALADDIFLAAGLERMTTLRLGCCCCCPRREVGQVRRDCLPDLRRLVAMEAGGVFLMTTRRRIRSLGGWFYKGSKRGLAGGC